jgi:dihydroceramidase
MHLAMGCTLIRIFTFQQPLHVQRRNASIITVGLTSFIVYHCVADEFVLHVILFFALSVTVGAKTHSMIKSRTESKAQKKRLSSVVRFAQCK